MRKVPLNQKEQKKYEVIKLVVEGRKTKARAEVELGVTRRTVDRLCKKYREEGKAGFLHGNRGRRPAGAYDQAFKNEIIDLYVEEYSDTNFNHFSDIVEKDYGVRIHPSTLNKWMRERDVLSPMACRKTKKALKKQLKAREKNVSEQERAALENTIRELDRKDAHPLRPRSKYQGEMLQMDACSFCWIPGEKWHLHLSVADADGKITGAWFDKQETLNGYYHVLHQTLISYGIPCKIYTDRRTVFEYRKNSPKDDSHNTPTQFSYACQQLGIEIKTTSVPQAKGRIERLNKTLKSRLPVELRRAGVKSIDEANVFLSSYILEYNAQFALPSHSIKSAYETQPGEERLDQILAVLSRRSVNEGHCVKFENHYFLPASQKGKPVYLAPKTKVVMIRNFKGELFISTDGQVYLALEVEKHDQVSKELDPVPPVKAKARLPRIPAENHPWRRNYFDMHISKRYAVQLY